MTLKNMTPLMIPLIIGAAFSSFHLSDGFWFDEINNIHKHVSPDLTHCLTHYFDVCNHILVSFILSVWEKWVNFLYQTSVIYCRVIPWMSFLLSIFFMAKICQRHFGNLCAVFAGVFFVTSHIVLNFSLQLRGYGFSWLPIILQLGCLLEYLNNQRKGYLVAYVMFSVVSTAYLFTNLIANGIFLTWFVILWGVKGLEIKVRFWDIAWLAFGPLLGFLVYMGLWEPFVSLITQKSLAHHFNLLNITEIWMWNLISDTWHLIVGALVGVVLLLSKNTIDKVSSQVLMLLLSMIVFLSIILSLTTKHPPPRAFVPLLPIYFMAMSYFFTMAFRKIASYVPQFSTKLTAVALLGVVLYASFRELAPEKFMPRYQEINKAPDYSLGNFFYHQEYYPEKAISAVLELAQSYKICAFYGGHGIKFLMGAKPNYESEQVSFYHEGYIVRLFVMTGPSKKIVFIGRSPQHAIDMANSLGIEYQKDWVPQALIDTGYFKIYECPVVSKLIKIDREQSYSDPFEFLK